MADKKRVSFSAHKKVKQPTRVSFSTKKGRVSFTARKEVTRPVRVSFTVKNKKK